MTKGTKRKTSSIHPDDYWAYEAGFMVGYEPDGSWKEGPNYAAWLSREAEDEEDEDEDDDE